MPLSRPFPQRRRSRASRTRILATDALLLGQATETVYGFVISAYAKTLWRQGTTSISRGRASCAVVGGRPIQLSIAVSTPTPRAPRTSEQPRTASPPSNSLPASRSRDQPIPWEAAKSLRDPPTVHPLGRASRVSAKRRTFGRRCRNDHANPWRQAFLCTDDSYFCALVSRRRGRWGCGKRAAFSKRGGRVRVRAQPSMPRQTAGRG